MGLGDGLNELSQIASSYVNNGMKKQGAYEAVRQSRARFNDYQSKPKAAPDTSAPVTGDAVAPQTTSDIPGAENA